MNTSGNSASCCKIIQDRLRYCVKKTQFLIEAKSPRTLSELVEIYFKYILPELEIQLEWFSSPIHIMDLIQRSAASVYESGQIHPHQKRIGKEYCLYNARVLKKRHKAFASATSFDEIYQIIKTTKSLHQAGELFDYDVALRIGYGLDSQCLPKMVYLHAGAKSGAQALLLKHKLASTLSVTDFPQQVRILEPYQIEDFLCVCKRYFRNVDGLR